MNDTWQNLRITEDENYDSSCTCSDCGKVFQFGNEGDNENICLRCEAIFVASINDEW